MILAFDTHYFEDKAKTVCVSYDDWTDESPTDIRSEVLSGIAAYQAGSFYKREMPCILSLLKQYDLNEVECIIVDGYVVLDDGGKPGLGAHLYKALEKKVPIIGVAKSHFYQNDQNTLSLLRGESKKPLFISSIGMDVESAFKCIQSMYGKYRMPTLLQILDTETKTRDDKTSETST